MDSVAGDVRACATPAGVAPVVPERRGVVAAVLDSAVPAGAGAAPSRATGHAQSGSRGHRRGVPPARRTTLRDLRRYRQAFLLLRRVRDLQRRHQHDHPDGDDATARRSD